MAELVASGSARDGVGVMGKTLAPYQLYGLGSAASTQDRQSPPEDSLFSPAGPLPAK